MNYISCIHQEPATDEKNSKAAVVLWFSTVLV